MTHSQKHITAIATALALVGVVSAAEVTINVDGVEARGGTLYVALQTEAQFMKEEGISGTLLEAPEAGTATFTLNVPAGRYALAVWHDENGNNVFDRMEDGQPLDGWAMINGSKLTGLPTFDFVSIDVPEEGAEITETIVYGR